MIKLIREVGLIQAIKIMYIARKHIHMIDTCQKELDAVFTEREQTLLHGGIVHAAQLRGDKQADDEDWTVYLRRLLDEHKEAHK